MSLQGHYLCKFPAWYIIIINRMVACAHRVALAVLRGGQAASAQSCTHPAKRDHRFHLQSWRDSDCQMSEFKMHNIFYNSNVDICPVSYIAFVEQIC